MRRGEAGFSLIELMVALAAAAVVSTTVFGTLIFQQQASTAHLHKAEAQQSARVALEVVSRYLRQAGWGFAAGASAGAIPIGSCNNTDPLACNGVDAGSDRLRVRYALGDGFVYRTTWQPGNNMFRIAPKEDAGGNPLPDVPGHPIPDGTVVMVSGPCACPGPDCNTTATDLVTITGDVADGHWHHKYQYSGTTTCNYDEGFNFGRAAEVDLYIDRADAAHPTLMLDLDGSGSEAPMIVAYDIEHLQVRYRLDGNDPPTPDDTSDDIWCHDPRLAACATGLTSDRANLARINAAEVAIVARTREPRGGTPTPDLTVFDHTIPGDGYRRWVLRSTIVLRNLAP